MSRLQAAPIPARPWVEASQSYEKNQLGLNAMFFNSLRLTWQMSLPADAVLLLRARALLGQPTVKPHLYELTPDQLFLDLPHDEDSER